MQVYNDSRPASGAEHLLSHVWEMEHLSSKGIPVSHGFKVSMGTVITTSLMEAFYSLPLAEISVEACRVRRESWEERRASVAKWFPDPKIREVVIKVCEGKWISEDQWENRIKRLGQILPELRAFTMEKLGSSGQVKAKLQTAGCPVSPEVYGLDREAIKNTVIKAQMIRKRYTILDIMYETGLLKLILDRLF